MSGSTKICGVLIENIIKNNSIKDIIIGIGLNVNQTEFFKSNVAQTCRSLVMERIITFDNDTVDL